MEQELQRSPAVAGLVTCAAPASLSPRQHPDQPPRDAPGLSNRLRAPEDP